MTFSQGQRPTILNFIEIGLAVSEISQFYVLRKSKNKQKREKERKYARCSSSSS